MVSRKFKGLKSTKLSITWLRLFTEVATSKISLAILENLQISLIWLLEMNWVTENEIKDSEINTEIRNAKYIYFIYILDCFTEDWIHKYASLHSESYLKFCYRRKLLSQTQTHRILLFGKITYFKIFEPLVYQWKKRNFSTFLDILAEYWDVLRYDWYWIQLYLWMR